LSPSPEHVEYADVLLRRSQGDLHACRLLAGDADIDDSIVGFHAQQAVEKAIKTALVLAETELPRTHDLELLVELAQASGIDVPDELASVEWLTPWAAELRYDEPAPLDREAALAVAERASNWAAALRDA
jgi:HEPN domain-containing protein